MERREYLRAAALVGTAGAVAGCTDLVETREVRSAPPVLADRPDGVYHPTHVDGMEMVGTGESNDSEYAVALAYTYPHRFWRVDGAAESVEAATRERPDGEDVHLMGLVWDPETGRTLPEAGVSVGIRRDGEPLDEQVIYPMLSPQMGFHYGANFALEGDGEYTVEVTVGGTGVRRTGAYRGRFEEAATVTVPFEYSAAARDDIPVERTPERAGDPDVPPVMNMDVPLGVAPVPDSLPGTGHGTAAAGDLRLAVRTLEAPPTGVDGDGTYLAVSARTPYNGLVVPMTRLGATLERDGETAFEGRLRRTFDDRLGYHYGAVVDSVESGDELAVGVRTPPQVARHEGYETAFLEVPDAELTLSF
jgi:hypothetical protein